jgi:NAD(P)H-dependent FMN reductase
MDILCIAGSNDPNSLSTRSAEIVAEIFAQRGATAEVLCLRELALPNMDIDAYHAETPHPLRTAKAFIARVAQADAIVLATPVHHASYSGTLKNALDYLRGDAFSNRAVGLIANAGGHVGATIACEHLRSVAKAMGGWCVPTQIATSGADFVEESGAYADPWLERRASAMVDEMWLFTASVRQRANGPAVAIAP